MTDLRQLMHETVEHERADMVRLATRARRRGATMRRRRRVVTTVSSLAVFAVIGAGLAATGGPLTGEGNEVDTTAVAVEGGATAPGIASPTWSPAPDCSDQRADLESTPVPEAREALTIAVRSVMKGRISDARGERVSATCHHPEHVGASLRFAPDAGSSEVQVSTAFLAPGEFDYAGGAEAYVSTCELGDLARSEDCQVSTLPDGTTLRTHSFTQRSGGVDTTWQIAERLVDGYIVNINAIGPQAVFSHDQIVELVSQLTPIE